MMKWTRGFLDVAEFCCEVRKTRMGIDHSRVSGSTTFGRLHRRLRRTRALAHGPRINARNYGTLVGPGGKSSISPAIATKTESVTVDHDGSDAALGAGARWPAVTQAWIICSA
jgi:hypothetical protein